MVGGIRHVHPNVPGSAELGGLQDAWLHRQGKRREGSAGQLCW